MESDAKQRMTQAAVVSVVAEIFNKIVPIVIFAWVAHRLGVSAFGRAQAGISWIEACVPWVVFGYHVAGALAIGREAEDPVRAGQAVGAISILKLGHALLALLCLGVAAQVGAIEAPVAGLGLFLLISALDVSYLWVSRQQVLRLAFWTTAGKAPALVGTLLWVREPKDLWVFAGLHFFANAVVSIASWHGLVGLPLRLPPSRVLVDLWRRSVGPAAGVLALGLLERIDMLLASSVLGEESLGSYAGAYRLVASAGQVLTALALVFFSEGVRLAPASSEFWRVIWVSARTMLGVAFAGLGVGLLGADTLVPWILGQEFEGAIPCFKVLVWLLPINALVLVIGSQVLMVQGRGHVLALVSILACGVLAMVANQLVASPEDLAKGTLMVKAAAVIVLVGSVGLARR